MDSSVVIDANPGLSPSRFVKVFMHGKAFGRKINLALHNSYDSLSLTLKRLGSNYSLSQEELNNLAMNEEDGAADDNDFVLWLFTISVKKIYIAPPENQDDNGDYLEEGAGDNGDGNGGAAVGDEVAIAAEEVGDGVAIAEDEEVLDAAGEAEEAGDGAAIGEVEDAGSVAGDIGDGSVEDADMPEI
ncbi:putative auxin-responsive protein IAA29 [Brachypodium distachyon]|uniref:putative auxin-responsive protein IAA29 n=1 Tax=Brachypodium distachyon TaxID=15368 RepID=UPI000D0DB348|nr:putative auxin-responsive protein IAA29 [Brachypodium distachyon]|eukprot:XP_024310356.1 putative auxin-responsive protein IAA29 [Brachypodium distachyon]